MLLVTGITGHSGSYFLNELVINKYEEPVRCVVRENSETSKLDSCGLKIEKLIGDLGNQEFMDKAMVDVDLLIHIGSIFYSVKVMKAAIKNNVKKAILVHTTGIYSKYKSASEEYKRIELTIEEIVKESNFAIDLIYLRPTMIYGNINDKNMIVFIKMVDKLRLFPVISNGNGLLQPVNGRDLGKAYYQVLSTQNVANGDYILSGEKPITMHEMFNLISNKLGKKTVFLNIPIKLGVFMAICLKVCTFGKVDYIERVQRMGEDRSFSHDDATRDFGYHPMPFEEGIKIEVEQYLGNRRNN